MYIHVHKHEDWLKPHLGSCPKLSMYCQSLIGLDSKLRSLSSCHAGSGLVITDIWLKQRWIFCNTGNIPIKVIICKSQSIKFIYKTSPYISHRTSDWFDWYMILLYDQQFPIQFSHLILSCYKICHYQFKLFTWSWLFLVIHDCNSNTDHSDFATL